MAIPAKQKTEITQSGSNINPDEIRLAIDRVMASKHFAHAPMKQKFLRLICEFHLAGRGAELNEYLIGREVFDRDNSYNPATDPIVRVGAHGVREKLERYYQKEGVDDEIQIEIPIGSYEPSFVRIAPQSFSLNSVENAEAETPPKATTSTGALQSPSKTNWVYLGAGISLLIIATLLYLNFDLRRQISKPDEEKNRELELYKPVWQPFLESSDPTLSVLSNPPVFRFLNSADPNQLIKKSIPVSSAELATIYEALPNKSIIGIISNPRLTLTTDTYTGMGEAVGIYRITALFRILEKTLTLKQSRTVSAEDLKNKNVVALGSVWVNNWSSKLPVKEGFVYTNQVTLRNLNPKTGEQNEYSASFDPQTGKLTEDYALITVAPNISIRNVVMVLAGLHSEGTAAAAEYITGKQFLSELNQRLAEVGNGAPPKYFQALLKVGVDNGIPTTIALVTVHEIRAQ